MLANARNGKEQHPAGQERHTGPRIVAGVDGSPSSMSALRWAIRQAALTSAEVDAVIAWNYPVTAGGWMPTDMEGNFNFEEDAEKILADAISSTVNPGNIEVHARAVQGVPAQVLLDASDSADLLVVGSRGHGGFAEALLGSVSQHCVQHAHCPVVVIRGQDKK